MAGFSTKMTSHKALSYYVGNTKISVTILSGKAGLSLSNQYLTDINDF